MSYVQFKAFEIKYRCILIFL